MQTAPSSAFRASSAKLARATRLSREYSVFMGMSSRMRSMKRVCGSSRAARISGPTRLYRVVPGEREDVNHLANVVALCRVLRCVAHQEHRPGGRFRVERRTPNLARLASPRERGHEPFMRLFPQIASEIAKPAVGLTPFDHSSTSRGVRSRKATGN